MSSVRLTDMLQYVEGMLAKAIHARASDIHLEPSAHALTVRIRVDGCLQAFASLPKALHAAIVSHIKILAGMNIAEKRLPQDGRIGRCPGTQEHDIRVASTPSVYGESLALRILDPESFNLNLHHLGLLEDHLSLLESLIQMPEGMLLVTGPTGSGKTTTLYAILQHLNTLTRKIITVEDPIEYELPGVHQVPIQRSIQMDFAAALRSILRQAPDVIMIGEIRDPETAHIAMSAAITGHKVFSSLHTHNTPGALIRLMDMQVQPFLLAAGLKGIMAQRLVRKVCMGCRGAGDCELCQGTGFYQRMGIFELLRMTEPIQSLIQQGIQRQTLSGLLDLFNIRTLAQDGMLKVQQGLTTEHEVLSWTSG